MNRKDKEYVKQVIDHFIDFYKLDLRPYNKAYKIWFENDLHSEIIVDFLKRVNMPSNIRLIKKPTRTSQYPHRVGYVAIDTKNPIYFLSEQFKHHRFEIAIDPDRYTKFEFFITTLVHELSHIVLYSTRNKYRDSEVATDLFVMFFGLYTESLFVAEQHEDTKGYITKGQVMFAHDYIVLKKAIRESNGITKIINKILLRFL